MNKHEIPILIPYEQSEFWKQIGTIVHRVIKEELAKAQDKNDKKVVLFENAWVNTKAIVQNAWGLCNVPSKSANY